MKPVWVWGLGFIHDSIVAQPLKGRIIKMKRAVFEMLTIMVSSLSITGNRRFILDNSGGFGALSGVITFKGHLPLTSVVKPCHSEDMKVL